MERMAVARGAETMQPRACALRHRCDIGPAAVQLLGQLLQRSPGDDDNFGLTQDFPDVPIAIRSDWMRRASKAP